MKTRNFPRRPPVTRGHRRIPWWDHECGTLAANLRFADGDNRRAAKTALKMATIKAKREQANAIINEAQKEHLWRIAEWHHRCHPH